MLKYLKTGLIILSLLNIQSCYNLKPQYDTDRQENIYKFPNGFLWGTATAAYQVEGGIKNDWSTTGLDAGNASDSYKKYQEDIKASKELGNNAYRFSLEWSRIEPEQGKFDFNEVEHYRQMLKSLKANGITPIVTLHHFTNPIWIANMGGWENEKTIIAFSAFVKFIVNELQDLVDIWITVNEPNVYAFKAYDAGAFPPYKKERKLAIKVMGNLIKAHGEAYRIIHDVDKTDADGDGNNAMVSFAHHIALFEPLNPVNPLDQLMTHFENQVFNEAYWQSIESGELKLNIPGVDGVNEPFNANLKDSMDFVGINYYTRWFIYSDGSQNAKKSVKLTDLGWEIYPDGMLTVLKTANKYASKRNLPIIITENGIDDSRDRYRSKYLVTHIKKIWEAILLGIPVKGYMYWSLIDNFEWADQFKPKFGLMTIDRKMRDSAKIYKDISTNNGISQSLVDKYSK